VWRPAGAPPAEFPGWLAWSDGEVYEAVVEPPHEIPLSFVERMAVWWDQIRSVLRGRRGAGAAEVELPFDVGDRVFDEVALRPYTVIASTWKPTTGWVAL
jgi:hypothetical protein